MTSWNSSVHGRGDLDLRGIPGHQPWRDPAVYWPARTEAVAHLATPVASLDAEALRFNAQDLLRRAGGTPLRVASKSLRVRSVVDALLDLPGFRGILAFTLAEALWLAERCDDVVVGYPSADRGALGRLASDERLAARVTLMIDAALPGRRGADGTVSTFRRISRGPGPAGSGPGLRQRLSGPGAGRLTAVSSDAGAV